MSEYAARDAQELGEYYTRHVMAMTAEALHKKSDIAAELAYRDRKIDELKADLAQANKSPDHLRREDK